MTIGRTQHGIVIEWFDRQDIAEEFVEGKSYSEVATMHIVEIPASRLGIVAWLNENYTREN